MVWFPRFSISIVCLGPNGGGVCQQWGEDSVFIVSRFEMQVQGDTCTWIRMASKPTRQSTTLERRTMVPFALYLKHLRHLPHTLHPSTPRTFRTPLRADSPCTVVIHRPNVFCSINAFSTITACAFHSSALWLSIYAWILVPAESILGDGEEGNVVK